MIKKIDHVAVVVRSIEASLPFYERMLGIKCAMVKEVPTDGVRIAFLPLGESEIELVEPVDPNSGVARFLESRGEGLHHICLDVDDIDQEIKALAEKGAALIDKAPREGAAAMVAFMHPKAASGVLIELSQRQ